MKHPSSARMSPDAELLHSFANTLDLRTFRWHGQPRRTGPAEALHTPLALDGWLRAHHLLTDPSTPTQDDLGRATALRATLRTALARSTVPPTAGPPPPGASSTPAGSPSGQPAEPVLPAGALLAGPGALAVGIDLTDPDRGPVLVPAGSAVDAALAEIAAAAVRVAVRGEWRRLKVCAAEDCRWVFYDRSKPARGRWCAPELCGNRMKTRAYRTRRGSAAADREALG